MHFCNECFTDRTGHAITEIETETNKFLQYHIDTATASVYHASRIKEEFRETTDVWTMWRSCVTKCVQWLT